MVYIVIASLALNAILIIGILIFAFKLIKLKEQQLVTQNQLQNVSNDYVARKTEEKNNDFTHQRVETISHDQAIGDYCVDHSTEVSIGNCAISGNAYCKHCLKTFQNIKVGKKYLNMFLASDWLDFLVIPKRDIYDDVDPRLLDLKRELWENEKMPIIVQNHYKINIDSDQIESYTVFKSRKEDVDSLKIRFKELSSEGIQ